jgi:Ca2+/Na+ antiporter
MKSRWSFWENIVIIGFDGIAKGSVGDIFGGIMYNMLVFSGSIRIVKMKPDFWR